MALIFKAAYDDVITSSAFSHMTRKKKKKDKHCGAAIHINRLMFAANAW